MSAARGITGAGPIPDRYRNYPHWWQAENVRCSSCGRPLYRRLDTMRSEWLQLRSVRQARTVRAVIFGLRRVDVRRLLWGRP